MSTFNGIVHEFPEIAIDFFRIGPGRPPPLACFLSHVHSDHLAGLDLLRSPFVYCSAATCAILLELQKRANRVDCANGLLEAPVRTYKHLKTVLRPIPLETPTLLELQPGNNIQVTLFDANHCPGAVMFLIQGHGKAVLYTGDIRSEPWWVNSIARNPCLVEYTSGLKILDRIYLDTSLLDDYTLQTKAEGLQHLLSQVVRYPKDTIFCMQAWTYGYEEVWIALSKALQSKIHVDNYKMRVYRSLVTKSSEERFPSLSHHSKEAPFLVGFNSGKRQFEGCLTRDENVRIHSCEKGTPCTVMNSKPIVWIQPVVAHFPNGEDISEVGLGGGGDDLEQNVELAKVATDNMEALLQVIQDSPGISRETKKQIKSLLMALVDKENSQHESAIDALTEDVQTRLGSILCSMIRLVDARQKQANAQDQDPSLPSKITFSYARHSAYPELRHLVETFRPKDVWPCTVDVSQWEERDITMQKLFGSSSSGDVFQHDLVMKEIRELHKMENAIPDEQDTQDTTTSTQVLSSPVMVDQRHASSTVEQNISGPIIPSQSSNRDASRKRTFEESQDSHKNTTQSDSQGSISGTRQQAFQFMTQNLSEGWQPIHLISTTDHHTELEEELGQL